jgi:hypothetical protein
MLACRSTSACGGMLACRSRQFGLRRHVDSCTCLGFGSWSNVLDFYSFAELEFPDLH